MAGKPKLHYFNAQGRMESIQWLLAAAGVEFEEQYLKTAEDLQKLINASAHGGNRWLDFLLLLLVTSLNGLLQFLVLCLQLGKDAPSTQVLLELHDVEGPNLLLLAPPPARKVEIDGMKLAQTRAILNYIAAKYNLYGRDIKERALIDMYSEGIADWNEITMRFPLCPPDQKNAKMTQVRERTTNRYFPAFEKVLKSHAQHYLVGNRLSKADIHLVELIYHHKLGQRHGTKCPSEPFEGINFDDTLISDFRLLEL